MRYLDTHIFYKMVYKIKLINISITLYSYFCVCGKNAKDLLY